MIFTKDKQKKMNNKPIFARIRKSKTVKLVLAFAAINLLVEMAFPTVAMALTSGAASPEFASFEPVATTDMVNDFTGDFTYNLPVLSVPGPDGGGYSMSLSYHSGVSSEEEASWVGFGWTLNPGAINRQKRGFADEFNGQQVTRYNKTKPNWTQLASFDFNMEYSSADQKDPSDTTNPAAKVSMDAFKKAFSNFSFSNSSGGGAADASFSLSKSIRYNNYSGFNIVNGFGIGAKGMASLNMNRSAGETTLGFSINPIRVFQHFYNKKTKKLKEEVKNIYKNYNGDEGERTEAINKENQINKRTKFSNGLGLFNSSYSAWSFNAPSVPYSVAKTEGRAYNFSTSFQVNPAGPFGFQAGIRGSMNYQIAEPVTSHSAYGYMHNPPTNESWYLSDYQIEKPSTFNKHDRNLGIPFNSADLFAATGNGVIGGFQFHHDQVGHFYPPFTENEQRINQLGVEFGIGGTIQVGFDFGLGFQKTTVDDWTPIGDDFDYSSATEGQLRFNEDMGGEIDYSGNDGILTASVGGDFFGGKLDISNFNNLLVGDNAKLETAKKGQSSYIEPILYGGIFSGMTITNKDGNKSKYGKPIYVYEETELTIGLQNDILNDGASTVRPYIYHGQTVDYGSPASMPTSVVGQKNGNNYASSFLLTENTTFDYVDADGIPGPSDGDFGGWTKFNYRDVHSDYCFRAPYTGLIYDRGRLFDGDDQTGSMSSGTKDVKYLKTVETKTHIAFFVTNMTQSSDFPNYTTLDLTGSLIERTDGVDAEPTNGGLPSPLNRNYLEKLERIVLYAKNDLSQPISTTYFEYNNTLVQGIPNSTEPPGNNSGKLTLKRVWTESGGTIKSKIAPYQFEYEYFTDYPQEIIGTNGKYPDLLDGISSLTKGNLTSSISDQNPVYQAGQLDMWGMYRTDGISRFQNMKPWVNQKDNNTPFDPAAWQLKRIILPSGGEIHVQYEQKDYRYVQDKEAMAMVSLLSHPDFSNSYDPNSNKYFINTQDLGLSSVDEIEAYRLKLESYFVTGLNKLYFKILYSLTANYYPTLDNFNHRYDYITGYTTVNEVVSDGSFIYLQLGKLEQQLIGGDYKDDKTMPRWVGYKKLHEQADMTLGWDAHDMKADDNTIFALAYNGSSITSDLSQIGKQFNKANTFNLFGNWVSGTIKNVSKDDACKSFNPTLSYFKLPIYKDKKGGGIRVKRLLSYDPGISGETGDAMVYGSEYIYKNEDGRTSGVATNEPQEGREENPLVTIVERNKQSGWDKLLNGQDSKEHEGPLGESLLPGASVVYERVIIKNIHSGIGSTTTGYAVNKYHTTRTFPMQVDYSEISKDGGDPSYRKFNLNLPLGLFNLSINRAWVTQGYLFKLNDMHGKPMSQATYAGNYNPLTFQEAASTSKTAYAYSTPGTAIASLIYNPDSDTFEPGTIKPGQEEDLTMFRSQVTDRTNDFSLELDLNIILPTAVSLGFGLSYDYQENKFCQHVTSKVLRQKSYLLATTTTTDGVTQTTENLAFDKYTGDPVLTRTYDGYKALDEVIKTEGDNGDHNGHYYALNIPASWVYNQMGRKSDNPTNSNQLTASVGNVVTYGVNALINIDPVTNKPIVVQAIGNTFTNIVNASATVYKKDWFVGNTNQIALETEYPAIASNSVALNSHYYPLRTYVYRDEVTNANNPNLTTRIYGGGLIQNPFNFFNWNDVGGYQNNEIGKWYSASEIVSYSPHGYPIEEKDVLNINSTAKFGYNSTLPVLVSQNAQYKEVQFTDFEYGSVLGASNLAAHSGVYSFDYGANQNHVFADNYPISNEMITDSEKGISIKLWLKSSLSNNPSSPNYGLKNASPQLKAKIGSQQFNFKKIAQTGDWSLYVANIKNFNTLSQGNYDIRLGYNYQLGEQVLIDDFRIQPLDAVMNCTVYTKDNKVAAQFDDQHFGVFYEYNNKGQLVRKSIETERGKKTLQEQQYNTPLISR